MQSFFWLYLAINAPDFLLIPLDHNTNGCVFHINGLDNVSCEWLYAHCHRQIATTCHYIMNDDNLHFVCKLFIQKFKASWIFLWCWKACLTVNLHHVKPSPRQTAWISIGSNICRLGEDMMLSTCRNLWLPSALTWINWR